MTSLPAAHFGITDRGELRAGAFADITLFDPQTVRDGSTYSDPHRLSEGITQVIVNGAIVLSDGRLTGMRPGRWA